jgi:ribose 5-phosphate isomerase B
MQVAIGADHAGFELKETVAGWVAGAGHEVVDVGAFALDPQDDFPDFAEAVGRAVQDGRAERGIMLCGSAVGACVAANKLRGIRAATCHDTYSAHQGVEHDAMNVLCLGGRIVGTAVAEEIVAAYLTAIYVPEERFQRRLDKVMAIEESTGGIAGE